VNGLLLLSLVASCTLGAMLSCCLLHNRPPPSGAGLGPHVLHAGCSDLMVAMNSPAYAITCLASAVVLLAHPLSVVHLCALAGASHKSLGLLAAQGLLLALFVCSVVVQLSPPRGVHVDEVLPG
jgi:hypothetical protein